MAANSIDRGALAAAVEAGNAIANGARVTAVRVPMGEGGIIVHLFGKEQEELSAALLSILARRVEFKAREPAAAENA